MKFDELDKKLRIYETAHDYCVIPGIYIIARLDGRGFTRLTKKVCKFEIPFDQKFRDFLIETTKHLMNCGFKIIYGYTESDEISLLFDIAENTFSRKLRKLNSVLAGEASAKFTNLVGTIACFDCRISQIPTKQLLVDYFRWRSEDAHRNALNSHCYWILRKDNYSKREATSKLKDISTADKNELLFKYGINFNELPKWQKRGVGIYWEDIVKEGFDPVLKQKKTALRKKLKVDLELPMRDEYDRFILKIIESNENNRD